MPTVYGNTHSLSRDDFCDILKFNPAGKTKFLHCWLSCLQKGEAIAKVANKHSPLSEEGWKSALQAHLLGESLEFFFAYTDLSLKDLLQTLCNRYKKPVNLRELQKEFENL